MSNSSDKPSASSKPLNESYQGAAPKLNIRSDQGGIPLSQTGSQVTITSHRIGDSNTGQPALSRPPMPPKTGK